jgi:TolB-like protein
MESLAVLPLDNLSGDPAQDFFAEGMTEVLITDLGKIGSLRVISRASVMKYKGSRAPLRDIAGDLKVDALVVGSVARAEGKVRITTQLYDAAEDRQLWAENYERDMRDVIALQREVAHAITGGTRAKVTPQETARLAKARPVNPKDYDGYLRLFCSIAAIPASTIVLRLRHSMRRWRLILTWRQPTRCLRLPSLSGSSPLLPKSRTRWRRRLT